MGVELLQQAFGGVYHLAVPRFEDNRGAFNKILFAPHFESLGLRFDFRESYFSQSFAGVIRGMHFQVPPFDHAKLVTIVSGKALDVVLDLRSDSPGYGQAATFLLDASNPSSVYIPSGFAHGFAALSDCTLLYNVTCEYAPRADAGIRWDSFGFDWPEKKPLLSDRDQAFIPLSEFCSPF